MGDSNKISLKPNMYGITYNKENDDFTLSFAYSESKEIEESIEKEIDIILSPKGLQSYIASLLLRAFLFDNLGNEGYAQGIFNNVNEQLNEIIEKIKEVNNSEEED